MGTEVFEAVRAVRAALPTQHADLSQRHSAAVAAMANLLSRAPDEALAPEDTEPFTRVFLQSVRQELEQFAEEVSGSLGAKCAYLDHPTGPAQEELARQRKRWGRDAQLALEPVSGYLSGWLAGGAITFVLADLPRDYVKLRSALEARTAFVEQQARTAIDRWLRRVEQDAGLAEAPAPVEAAPRATPAERLAELLAKAQKLGVRIRNAPDKPSERYLEKLAIQLAEVEQKRAAAAPPSAPPPSAPPPSAPPASAPPAPEAPAGVDPRERLAALLDFADALKVKVRSVPDAPSTSWMDKMEAKLVEVAQRRGVPVPFPSGGIPADERLTVPPPLTAPPRIPPEPAQDETPAPATRRERALPSQLGPVDVPREGLEGGHTVEAALPPVDEERRARIESLMERAAETGLELGRVPPDPSDAWVAETEAKLDAAIERRKAERRAERKRREAERQARVEWIREQSASLGVDIGAIPAFPTDDWMARAEVRLQAALLQAPDKEDARSGFSNRALRLSQVLEAAAAVGVDLGEVPPDPDEMWILWAEGQVDNATAAAEPIVPEAEAVPTGQLIFEEGTVQEQVYPVPEEGELSVGRGKGNTVQIRDDAGVSRRHCTIRLVEGRFLLRDEGSTKGTLVNGVKQQEATLTGDEQIQCGETQFVFRVRA